MYIFTIYTVHLFELVHMLLRVLLTFNSSCQLLDLSGAFGGSNNAGVMAIPFALSKDSIEMQFATNHVGTRSTYIPT
jgi:hypothetical protein